MRINDTIIATKNGKTMKGIQKSQRRMERVGRG
jgi:hypothetical protein